MAGVITACSKCGQENRVPYSKLDKLRTQGKCGACHAPLEPTHEPIQLERADDLRAVIEQSSVPVLVDFWAQWCGPCRMVAPEIAKVAHRRAGDWLVVKANTEVDPRLGQEHQVQSIPLMAVFQGGREVARTAGARPAAAIEAFVQQSLR